MEKQILFGATTQQHMWTTVLVTDNGRTCAKTRLRLEQFRKMLEASQLEWKQCWALEDNIGYVFRASLKNKEEEKGVGGDNRVSNIVAWQGPPHTGDCRTASASQIRPNVFPRRSKCKRQGQRPTSSRQRKMLLSY